MLVGGLLDYSLCRSKGHPPQHCSMLVAYPFEPFRGKPHSHVSIERSTKHTLLACLGFGTLCRCKLHQPFLALLPFPEPGFVGCQSPPTTPSGIHPKVLCQALDLGVPFLEEFVELLFGSGVTANPHALPCAKRKLGVIQLALDALPHQVCLVRTSLGILVQNIEPSVVNIQINVALGWSLPEWFHHLVHYEFRKSWR